MGVLLLRIRAWWDSADRTQRLVTIVGGGFLLLLLFGTFMIASRPKMGLLYGNLTDADQGAVITELQNMGVPVEFDGRGNVMVPSNRVPEIRAKMASEGKTPRGATYGGEELAAIGIANTPEVEKARLKGILEGELARSIEVMDGVASARVHITLEDDSPFQSEKKPAKAVVTLIEKQGSTFGSDEGRSIASMVANAVPGLDLDNVMIVNQFSESLFDPKASKGAQGLVATKLQTEREEADRRRSELQADLDRAFGPGATIAQVSLELDFDEREYEQTTNTPSETPVASQEMLEEMTDGAVGNGGVEGLNGQQPAAADPGADAGKYKNSHKVKNYLASVKTEQVKEAAGEVKTMAINVLADEAKGIDEAKLQSVIAGFLGPKAQDENFTATVTTIPFDNTASKQAAQMAAQQAGADRMQQLISLLPVGALLFIAFMVMRAIGKYAKNQTVIVATPDGQMMPLSMQTLPGGAAGVPDALASGQNPAQKALSQSVSITDEEELTPEIKAIKDKLNVPLEQIKKMSSEKPEVVAMLIKSWLLEEGIRR